jgi:methionine aminotransferase
MKVFRQIYQFANFCGSPLYKWHLPILCNSTLNISIKASFYQQKRDLFNSGIQDQNLALFHPKERFSKC